MENYDIYSGKMEIRYHYLTTYIQLNTQPVRKINTDEIFLPHFLLNMKLV